jgi:hypothetical protein
MKGRKEKGESRSRRTEEKRAKICWAVIFRHD